MDKRIEVSKSAHNSSTHTRRTKKRNNRRNNSTDEWCDSRHVEQNGSYVPPPEYNSGFWPQPAMQQPLLAQNGQRLFAAMSDPSVCGYSPMPVTYAMEPVSLPPMYRLYQPVPRPSCRPFRGRPRRNHVQNRHVEAQNAVSQNLTNGYSSLQESNLNYSGPAAYQNGDYASLPPTANNDTGARGEELNSEHRRYSDPGLGPADVPVHSQSEDSESLESGSSVTTVGRSNKLVLSLVEQMTSLKESNGQLFKELHETKSELENVKAELARLWQSTSADYQPGMLSDIVREIREASKAREEALISKVKLMMDDKPASRSTELDELKNQLATTTEEKTAIRARLDKLEEDMSSLKLTTNIEGGEIAALEEETLALRRELQEARASRILAENQAAKLEKLVGILRKKMNGATDEETVANIRELVVSGLGPTSGSTIPPKGEENRSSSDNNDTFSSSNPSSTDASSNNSNSPTCENSVSNSNTSLSGPVTDL